MRGVVTPGRSAALAVAVLARAAAVLALAPSGMYLYLPDPARPLAPHLTVEGAARPDGDDGDIYFVDVIVRKATLLERLLPALRDDGELVPEDAVNPAGLSDEIRRRGSRRQMSRSQTIAAAVALRELGYDVEARPTGAFVVAISPDTPAAERLEPGDVVVAVDGRRVRTPADVRRLISTRPPGTTLSLRIRRDRKVATVSLRTAANPERPQRSIIGVFTEPAADVKLPIAVRIDIGDVGGPSAGLAFALALVEKLGRDVDHGLKVAATGEIELDGDVTPIGGVHQKTIGARRSGVDVFLVPAGANAEEARRHAGDVRVIAVRTFQGALRELATLPTNARQ